MLSNTEVSALETFRAEFPLCTERAYFFPGSHGPLSSHGRAGALRVLDEWNATGFHVHDDESHIADQCVSNVARLFRCHVSQIAITTCTSDALNTGASLVLENWKRHGSPPANVVIHHECHAASSYGFVYPSLRGVPIEIRYADPGDDKTTLEAICDAVDANTIAVVVTHVNNWNGNRLDVVELASRFPNREFALLVDAAQTAGALDLADVVRVSDFVGMPAYKFLLGPAGIGFLVMAERWISEPGPLSVGWAGMKEPLPILPREINVNTTAAAFRMGIPNYLGLAIASEGIRLLADTGPTLIENQIREITEMTINRIMTLGLRLTTSTEWTSRGPVLTVCHPDAEGAMRSLATQGIDVGVERTEIRVDVHAYNNAADVERLVNGLAATL